MGNKSDPGLLPRSIDEVILIVGTTDAEFLLRFVPGNLQRASTRPPAGGYGGRNLRILRDDPIRVRSSRTSQKRL